MRLALVAILTAALPSQAAAVFLDRFESPVTSWLALGDGVTAELQSEEAHEGQALRFQYQRGAGLSAIYTLLQVPPTGAKALRCWLRTERPTLVYAAVYESDESGYGTMFTIPAGEWQEIELSFDRLRLAEDKVDENGQLDVDQIGGIGFADLSAFGLGKFEQSGPNTIWLDDCALTTDYVPSAYSQEGGLPFTLETFECNQRQWLALDGDLVHDPQAGTLTWTYAGTTPTATSLTAVLGAIGALPATGATHLLLTLTSQRRATMAILLQEEKRPTDGQDESRYYAVFEVSGGAQPTTHAIALKDLTLDTNNGAGDENGQLDLDQVATIMIGDVEAIFAQQPGPNTIVLQAVELASVN